MCPIVENGHIVGLALPAGARGPLAPDTARVRWVALAGGSILGSKLSETHSTSENRASLYSAEREPNKPGMFRLGAGRSQVQILYPRLSESPGNPGLLSFVGGSAERPRGAN